MNTNPFTNFVEQQWKAILGLVGTLLLVVAVWGVWSEYQSRRDREATNLLYDSQVSARAATALKKFAEAEKAYQPVFEKFPNSRAAFEAELQIGDLWMDAGNFDSAIAHYQKAVAGAKDSFSTLLARYTLGVAKESANKLQEAIQDYEEALRTQGSDFLKPEILMAQARCYEALNQAPKAIEIYKVVQDKFASRSYYSGAASAFEKQLAAKQL